MFLWYGEITYSTLIWVDVGWLFVLVFAQKTDFGSLTPKDAANISYRYIQRVCPSYLLTTKENTLM